MKLKDLLKESTWGKRAFGEKLPTIQDYQNAMNDKKINESRSGGIPANKIDSKTWMKLKYQLREQFDELVKIGEDYGVFESAQHTARTLKKIRKMWFK